MLLKFDCKKEDRQYTCNVILKRVHVTIVSRESNVLNTECMFVALVIQHVMVVRRIILLSVASAALPYLFTVCHNWHSFGGIKKVTRHKICAFIFSTTSVRNISHSKKNAAKYYLKCK